MVFYACGSLCRASGRLGVYVHVAKYASFVGVVARRDTDEAAAQINKPTDAWPAHALNQSRCLESLYACVCTACRRGLLHGSFTCFFWGGTGMKPRDALMNKLTYACMRQGEPELMHKVLDHLLVTGSIVVSPGGGGGGRGLSDTQGEPRGRKQKTSMKATKMKQAWQIFR